MYIIFYILSCIPRTFFVVLIDLYVYSNLFRFTSAYKITITNLKIAYPERNNDDLELLSRMSLRESFISVYETIYSWGRATHESNKLIFKIENNFLLKNNINKNKGVICVTYHNRSVDMLLTWINSQTSTVSLYKEIKNKKLEFFVKNKREINGSITVKTSLSGVRTLYKALMQNEVICFAADQVPKRGMGEYINFFGKKAYSTTLAQNLAFKSKSPAMYFAMHNSINGFLYISLNSISDDIYDDSKYLQCINHDIEKMIKKRPADYAWEYKRFKRGQPEGKNLYSDM